jgi:hypothetical protein
VLRLAAVVGLILSSVVYAESAGADGCRFCLDSVALQTRDGQPWTTGQPVTLVVRVAHNAAVPVPSTAQAVVMQTDGDRTKCLGVPLKLVQSDAASGLYAGLFFPFRPARYDGKLVVAGDIQDITFDMHQMVDGAAPAGELPAAEPIDTSARLPTLAIVAGLPAVRGAAFAFLAAVALGLYARQRRMRQRSVT